MLLLLRLVYVDDRCYSAPHIFDILSKRVIIMFIGLCNFDHIFSFCRSSKSNLTLCVCFKALCPACGSRNFYSRVPEWNPALRNNCLHLALRLVAPPRIRLDHDGNLQHLITWFSYDHLRNRREFKRRGFIGLFCRVDDKQCVRAIALGDKFTRKMVVMCGFG